MTHLESLLHALKRPKLLIKAARIGAKKYRRKYHLKALVAAQKGKDNEAFLKALLEQENDLEWDRQSGSAEYNVRKHITLLSALIAEAKLQATPLSEAA